MSVGQPYGASIYNWQKNDYEIEYQIYGIKPHPPRLHAGTLKEAIRFIEKLHGKKFQWYYNENQERYEPTENYKAISKATKEKFGYKLMASNKVR